MVHTIWLSGDYNNVSQEISHTLTIRLCNIKTINDSIWDHLQHPLFIIYKFVISLSCILVILIIIIIILAPHWCHKMKMCSNEHENLTVSFWYMETLSLSFSFRLTIWIIYAIYSWAMHLAISRMDVYIFI